ncbi:MAG: xanthine dehydrogenase FAD-binding subunit [Thermodesulfobacteriota bacterium]|nr:xanthine dehydrogenase FAD-binding subunit [Thermodesulfobacteriota bacterium]
MKAFDLYEPESIEEACAMLEKGNGEARILAGGTDLLVEMKSRLVNLTKVINLKGIDGLDYISFKPKEGMRIGALATWSQILDSDEVATYYPVLKQSAQVMASVQIRNMATLAGNICHASPAANGPIPLMLYEAECTIQGTAGKRTVPIEKMFAGVQRNSLKPGEILVEIHIPPPPELSSEGSYQKFATRKAMDLGIAGVGALAKVKNRSFDVVRIALAAVAPTPIRARKAEEFLTGKSTEDDLIREGAQIASKECNPISDVRASKEYRIELVKELTYRAIKKCTV